MQQLIRELVLTVETQSGSIYDYVCHTSPTSGRRSYSIESAHRSPIGTLGAPMPRIGERWNVLDLGGRWFSTSPITKVVFATRDGALAP